jgi:hypothetical protein
MMAAATADVSAVVATTTMLPVPLVKTFAPAATADQDLFPRMLASAMLRVHLSAATMEIEEANEVVVGGMMCLWECRSRDSFKDKASSSRHIHHMRRIIGNEDRCHLMRVPGRARGGGINH